MLGELGTRYSLSVTCIEREERWSLTCIPKPSPYEMHLEREYYGPNKGPDGPPRSPAVVGIDRKEHMHSERDILTL
jgi:hypothetical protein